MKKDLMSNIDKPKVFFDKLYQNKKEKNFKSILICINNEYNIDICGIAVKAISDLYSPFDINHLLKGSIPYFNLNIDTFIDYLKTIYQAMENDLALGSQYELIEYLVFQQPEFARVLLSNLIDLNDDTFIGYMVNLFVGFAQIDKAKIYDELFNLLYSDSNVLLQASIFALGELICKDNDDLHAKLLVNRLDELLGEYKPELYKCITSVLCKIHKLDNRVISIIYRLLGTKDDWVYFHVSKFLYQNCGQNKELDWFNKFILILTDTNCEHKGTIRNIDYVLSNIVNVEYSSLVIEFLDRWIKKSNYDKQEIPICDYFNMLFTEMINDMGYYCKLITRYMLSYDLNFNKVAFEMINYAQSNHLVNIGFDKETLLNSSYEDLLCLLIKSIGYIYNVRYLFKFDFSLLKICSEEGIYIDEFVELFYEYVCKNYPYIIFQLLNDNMDIINSNCKLIDLLKKVEKLMSEEKAYSLKEVKQPSRHVRQIALEQGREINRQFDVKKSESVFVSLCSKISLKYGNGWFRLNKSGSVEKVRTLQKFSHSVEIPKSQLSHKVSHDIQLLNFKLIRRGCRK